MSKSGSKKPKAKSKIGTMANLELRDDAWPEFEKLLKNARKPSVSPLSRPKKSRKI